MLTGDLNAAQVEWIIQYRISDPYKFLFKVRNPIQTLRDLTEATMREIVGDRTVNEIITIGRQEIEITVLEQLQEMLSQYETGIKVDQVILQDVNPPDEVKASFNEVNQAEQEKAKHQKEGIPFRNPTGGWENRRRLRVLRVQQHFGQVRTAVRNA